LSEGCRRDPPKGMSRIHGSYGVPARRQRFAQTFAVTAWRTPATTFVRGVPLGTIAAAGGASAAAGVAVAGIASLIPLAVVDRLTPPTVLAEK
jgi:hypothetical protein